MNKTDFDLRLERHYDELKWLYCELYHNNEEAFGYFIKMLRRCWTERKKPLLAQDQQREANPCWYRRRDLLGMMLYVNAFAGDLDGVKEKLDYIKECGVNYLHLMPLLESPRGAATAATLSPTSALSSQSWVLWRSWNRCLTPAGKQVSASAWILS